MSWNTENTEINLSNTHGLEATLLHLAEHYPHLQDTTTDLEDWVREALREDASQLGLELSYMGSREEALSFFWETRRLIRESIDQLNASLEDDWAALEGYRPLFPEYEAEATLLAA